MLIAQYRVQYRSTFGGEDEGDSWLYGDVS